LLPAYGLDGLDSLRPIKAGRSDDGRLYVKLQQLHAGLPVMYREIVVQAEPDGAIGAVIGELAPRLKVSPRDAKIDGDAAISRALTGLAVEGRWAIFEAPTLVVWVPDADEGGEPRLGYRALVEYQTKKGPALEEIVVAADDGALLAQYGQIFDALNRTVADYKSGCLGRDPITLPGTVKRKEGEAKAADEAINRIYDYVGATYWYYKHVHGRDSYDDKGTPLVSSAHVSFSTGFSCTGANAAWLNTPYLQMVYGDGDAANLIDLTLGLDVGAHELTHAVTSATSALVYRNESGALNESMSDVLGSTVEAWAASGGGPGGSPASITPSMDTWLIGEKVAGPMLPGGALRFLGNPTVDMVSKDYYPERYTGTGDNGGVHLNSGIPNLAFYLLSQGGGHPRSKTQTVVPGIGIEKAQNIFYLANTGKNKAGVALLPSSATFQVARFAFAQAAQNLYGRCSREWQNVHMAFDAVGVTGGWTPCVLPPGGF